MVEAPKRLRLPKPRTLAQIVEDKRRGLMGLGAKVDDASVATS